MKQRTYIYSCRISDDGTGADFGDRELIFPYWSFTKTVIAICALKLVERGKIALDDYIADRTYTLRHLLGHTSGLPDYAMLEAYRLAVQNDEEPWSRDDLFRAAMVQGPLFAPGCGWHYSNVGYMLARELLEQVSGQSFSDLFHEMIGRRLGLKSVELATTREQFSRVFWEPAKRYHPGWVYHGCLIGSAGDAALILHALFTGKLLNAAMLEQMMLRHPLGGAIDGRPWMECGYGLGLMSGSFGKAGRAIGHSGGGPFCVNAVYHFPDRRHPVTVASFTDGCGEGKAEFETVRCSNAILSP